MNEAAYYYSGAIEYILRYVRVGFIIGHGNLYVDKFDNISSNKIVSTYVACSTDLITNQLNTLHRRQQQRKYLEYVRRINFEK